MWDERICARRTGPKPCVRPWLARLLAVLAAVWLAAGLWLCIDALDGQLIFPIEIFALLVLLESVIAIALARSGLSRAPRLRLVQAGALAFVSLLILSHWDLGEALLALLFAAAFALDGVTRIVTAWHVRFPGWRPTILGGALLLVLAVTVATSNEGKSPQAVARRRVATGQHYPGRLPVRLGRGGLPRAAEPRKAGHTAMQYAGRGHRYLEMAVFTRQQPCGEFYGPARFRCPAQPATQPGLETRKSL